MARVHMVSCNFWQFPTANLKDKIQLAYLDPPYGTRLERGEPNSAHESTPNNVGCERSENRLRAQRVRL